MTKEGITYEQIISDLKNKIYKPIYFLFGEEAYFIDKITDYIADNILQENEKAFNQTILYGLETTVDAIITACRRFPMMSNYQIVIVKEAQNLKKIDDLLPYIEKPLKSTILVINYKHDSVDKRKKIFKTLQTNAIFFESKKINEASLSTWINKYLTSLKYSIDPSASILLSEYLGSDLNKIVNEIQKFVISLPQGTQITPNDIERYIGISKDFNIFELQKALGEKNILKANRIIQYFEKNPKNNPFILIIYNLYSFYSKVLSYHALGSSNSQIIASVLKIPPFYVKDYEKAANNYSYHKCIQIISILREYDLKAKGVENISTDDGSLMKEMIYKIMH